MADPSSLVVFVCTGAVCGKEGLALARAAKTLSQAEVFHGRLTVVREVCLGYCHQGPNVMLSTSADAWGHAPLPGTPGTKSLHDMDFAKLRDEIEQTLGKP